MTIQSDKSQQYTATKTGLTLLTQFASARCNSDRKSSIFSHTSLQIQKPKLKITHHIKNNRYMYLLNKIGLYFSTIPGDSCITLIQYLNFGFCNEINTFLHQMLMTEPYNSTWEILMNKSVIIYAVPGIVNVQLVFYHTTAYWKMSNKHRNLHFPAEPLLLGVIT